MIRQRVKEPLNTSTVLHMLEIGKMTFRAVWEKKLGQTDLCTKANILKVSKMVKENSNGQMAPNTRETLKRTILAEMVIPTIFYFSSN
jgi:hypothetical protein